MPQHYSLHPKVRCIDGEERLFYQNKRQPWADRERTLGYVQIIHEGKIYACSGFVDSTDLESSIAVFYPHAKAKHRPLLAALARARIRGDVDPYKGIPSRKVEPEPEPELEPEPEPEPDYKFEPMGPPS